MEYFLYHFQVLLLIMVRMAAMFFVAPPLSSASIKMGHKMILSLLISIVIFPIVQSYRYPVPGHIINYGFAALGEVMIGILIGFIFGVVMAGFQMAGQFFSMQMGLGMSEVLDPMSQTSQTIVGILYNLLGVFIFLMIGGHILLIRAVLYSYEKMPFFYLGANVNQNLLNTFESVFGAMFIVALKIALPVLGTLLLVSVSMGLLAKAAPQMNVLMLGFPIKILITFLIIMATAPIINGIIENAFFVAFDKIDLLQEVWR